mmetsp:Transcript_1608/g.2873  ORF Transcript_1608/g.2873 Transcript_1608/m.2873 type:complete len:134 (+) Transcript_1608:78-479(+)
MNIQRLFFFYMGVFLALANTSTAANDGASKEATPSATFRHDYSRKDTARRRHLRSRVEHHQQDQRSLPGQYNFPDSWTDAQASLGGGLILIIVIILILYCCCGCSLCDILMCYCCWELCCNDGAANMAGYGAM